MQLSPLRTIATSSLNLGKGVPPKENIARFWYKPIPWHIGKTEEELSMMKLQQMHDHPHVKDKTKKVILGGKPFAKGVVLKTLVKKPRKPNSANRKCVLVRLSTGKEMVAYVPGEGHNLQEHNVVLCRVGRLRDTPGVKIKCVRGVYDLPHVVKRKPE